MRVVVRPTAHEAGAWAAELVHESIQSRTIRVLGVATGTSPLPVYRRLRELATPVYRELTVFALDEYVGLPPTHPASYHAVVDHEITRPLGLDPTRVHVPDGLAVDLESASRAYEEKIRLSGGVDLQLLGIGANGHIGFNEPPSDFSSRTGLRELAGRTRLDNARFFARADEVPKMCVTQGIGTILEARSLLMIATGESKSPAVARAVEGPVSDECPASALQIHPDATIVLDHAAASRLSTHPAGGARHR